MKIKYLFITAVVTLLAACQSLAMGLGKPSGDTRNWKTYRVEVGQRVVQFSIPPGESREFPNYTIPKRIDLNREDLFDIALEGPGLLSRVWDYRSSSFVPVDGSLSVGMSVSRSQHPLDDLTTLRRAVEESSRLQAIKVYVEEGRTPPSDKPVRFEHARVAGREGWKVTYEFTGQQYVAVLDRHHYLGIYIRQNVSREDWRADAKAAVAAILNSIRIEPR